jgi:hypothetical protein
MDERMSTETCEETQMKADSKARLEEIRAETEATRARTEAIRARTKAIRKTQAEAERNGQWTVETEADRERWWAEIEEILARTDRKASPERITATDTKTDVKLEELTEPGEEMMQSAEEHHEVPDEDAVAMLVRIRKRRHRDRKGAAGRRLEPKELNRGDRGSRKKLAAACRKASHRSTVAWIKRNVFRKSWTCGFYGLWKEVTASREKVARCARHGREV